MKRLLLPLLALLGLSTASAAVTPQWFQADFDGDGRQDLIATTNLTDIVFNDRGEVVFWHPKLTAGQNLIQRKGEGQNVSYGFDNLKKQPNLVRSGKGLEVVLAGQDPKAAAEIAPVKFSTDLPNNRMVADFSYTQGGATVTKTVVIHPRQFGVDVDLNVTGAENYTVNFGGLGKNDNPQVKAVARGSTDVRSSGTVENVRYAALQEPASLLNSQAITALIVRPRDEATRPNATVQGGANANLALTLGGPAKLEVYGGKNELIRLYKEQFLSEPGLFQANIFGQLSLWIARLMDIFYGAFGNWFLVIVAITILIRLAIWPIMQGQMRYTTRLQFIQPEVQRINEQYKDDPQKKMEATMALYKEHNVNPAGCLPVFIQMPILIVLWNTMRNFEFDSGFLWLPDLSIPDPLYILAGLYVLANIAQLYISTRKTPEMFRQQAFIYLIFAYFALTFPAGVTLYWILSTLIGIVQQLLINRQMERTLATLNVGRVGAAAAGGPSLSKGGAPAPKAPASKAPVKTITQGKKQKE